MDVNVPSEEKCILIIIKVQMYTIGLFMSMLHFKIVENR
jgi:hypothetical protein